MVERPATQDEIFRHLTEMLGKLDIIVQLPVDGESQHEQVRDRCMKALNQVIKFLCSFEDLLPLAAPFNDLMQELYRAEAGEPPILLQPRKRKRGEKFNSPGFIERRAIALSACQLATQHGSQGIGAAQKLFVDQVNTLF
jgi:hypothetical protein